MIESWAIKAIEQEAERRAFQKLAAAEGIRIVGLDAKQVLKLKQYFENRTGKSAFEIVGDEL